MPPSLAHRAVALGPTGGGSTNPLALPADQAPDLVDAYAHLVPNPVLTATVGTKFTIDLYINSGTNTVQAQQSYMTFTAQPLAGGEHRLTRLCGIYHREPRYHDL